MTTKVKLIRPLDGKDAGSVVEYPDLDAKRLVARGAVEIVKEKAAPAVDNKMAPAVANKAAAPRKKKGE
ncbi:hypothetical protein M0654_03675 [Rhizobium sp. NTR19]|uniref:Uncharacterized protein n=1 Tax=Neorhizobium turbinariae TaxID=2937795 RepID=A0ABT0IMN4_9HYPH|nr:hypothetical protein [Neorhizobium turbinariae]MCK8779079.1 hypothetical protein [Neorhizobium turbinariae]